MAIRPRNGKYGVLIYRHGRQEWIGTFAARAEAREAEIRELAKTSTGHRETAGDFARRWVKEYPRQKASTRKLYAQKAAQFAADQEAIRADNRVVVLADMQLGQITRPLARAYSVKRPSMRAMLSAMFNDALNDGLVKENPFARLGLKQSRGRRDIKPLTEEEIGKLADLALAAHGDYGPTFRSMILFHAYTGLRPSEGFGLEWDDIDFDRSEIEVRRRSYDGELDLPKSNVTRRVILPPPAARALKEMPRAVGKPEVFLSKRGKPFRKARLLDYWTPVVVAFEATLDPARRRELDEARNVDRCGCADPRLANRRCESCGKPQRKAHGDFYEMTRHFCGRHLRWTLGLDAEDVAHQLGHQDEGDLVRKLYGRKSDEASLERLRRAFDRNVVPITSVDKEEAAHA